MSSCDAGRAMSVRAVTGPACECSRRAKVTPERTVTEVVSRLGGGALPALVEALHCRFLGLTVCNNPMCSWHTS